MNVLKLFARTWLPPFLVGVALLTAMHTGYFLHTYRVEIFSKRVPFHSLVQLYGLTALHSAILSINIAIFLSGGMAAFNLRKHARWLSFKLLPHFLGIIVVLSMLSFLLNAVNSPAIHLRQKALLHAVMVTAPGQPLAPVNPSSFEGQAGTINIFTLRIKTDSLEKAVMSSRQQLLRFIGKAMSRTNAIEVYAYKRLETTGITFEEVKINSTDTWVKAPQLADLQAIDLKAEEIRRLADTVRGNTERQWRYYQHPFYVIELFTLGFLIAITHRRRRPGRLILMLVTAVVLYKFFFRFDLALEITAADERLDTWLIYMIPVFVGAAACVLGYVNIRINLIPLHKRLMTLR